MSIGAPYCTRQGASAAEPVGALDACRDERHAGLERDPCGARVGARLVLLAQSLPAPRALGEHRDHIAGAGEVDRGLDRLTVGPAAVHLEGADAARIERERKPEELRLPHEPQEAPRPDREPERPGIEIRHVPGGQDVAAVAGQVLHSPGPVTEAKRRIGQETTAIAE